MNRYTLSQDAELDLLRVLGYIESRSERAAAAMERRFVDAFINLSEWPRSGHSRDDLPSLELRAWTIGHCVIVHGPGTRPLQIYAILHGARDLNSAFMSRWPGVELDE